MVSGFELVFFMALYNFENNKAMKMYAKVKLANTFLVMLSHVFIFILGILFVFFEEFNFNIILMAWMGLLIYYIFMFNRYDVKWILYEPSKFKINKRLILFRIIVLLLFFLIPFVSYLF